MVDAGPQIIIGREQLHAESNPPPSEVGVAGLALAVVGGPAAVVLAEVGRRVGETHPHSAGLQVVRDGGNAFAAPLLVRLPPRARRGSSRPRRSRASAASHPPDARPPSPAGAARAAAAPSQASPPIGSPSRARPAPPRAARHSRRPSSIRASVSSTSLAPAQGRPFQTDEHVFAEHATDLAVLGVPGRPAGPSARCGRPAWPCRGRSRASDEQAKPCRLLHRPRVGRRRRWHRCPRRVPCRWRGR